MITAYIPYHEVYAIIPSFGRCHLACLRFVDGSSHTPTHTHRSLDLILMITALYDITRHTIFSCLFEWPHVMNYGISLAYYSLLLV